MKLPFRHLCCAVTIGLMSAAVFARPGYSEPQPDSVSYNRDIRPLLVKNCFGCHGDEKQLEGNVLLKTFEDATGQTGYERVIVPGEPEQSLLFQRVAAAQAELRMPPPEAEKHLSAEDIATLERWIRAGAKYEQHWSYMPIVRPVPPQLDSDWPRNPIDHFVLARMQDAGLSPTPVADDRTLVRRLAMDLQGLVPSYADIQQQAGISRDNGRYESLVDELLASPHFGVRMAVPWLDWVKYSDEISDRGNYLTTFYPYRNYVIKAFNENKPFDQFTIEQLAGDLLPDPTPEQLVASAYNHLIVRVQDGVGAEAIHKYLTERVDKLGQVWLASSLECAQCHDHKFDTWSQKQYYQFAAFFSDLDRVGVWAVGVSGSSTAPRNLQDAYFKLPRVYLPTAQQETRLSEIDQQLTALREELAARQDEAESLRAKLVAEAKAIPDYFTWVEPEFSRADLVSDTLITPLEREVARPAGGNGAIVTGDIQFLRLNDASLPGRDYEIEFPVQHRQVSALMLRVAKQRRGDYSFNQPDEVAISEVVVETQEGDGWVPLAVERAESTDLGTFNERNLIDGDASTHWSVRPRDIFHKYRYERKDDLLLRTLHDEAFLVFTLASPLQNAEGKQLRVRIRYADEARRARNINLTYTPALAPTPFQKHVAGPLNTAPWLRSLRQGLYDFVQKWVFFTDFWDFTVSGWFTWVATNAGVSAPVPFNDIMKSVLATIKEMFAWQEIYTDQVMLRAPEFAELGASIRLLEREREKLWGEIERSWRSQSSTRDWPVRVLKAGEISDTSGERVGPGLPDFLGAPQLSEPTRLELGRWLVSDDNPLTARVMANRLWRLFMGRALVPTLEEFGSGGEMPSHPQLLDWLAAEFIDSGWDVKHLVRLIVTSNTYRQHSVASDENLRRDPENIFFARQGRFRLDAEFIQDFVLNSAGLLQPGLYGEHTEHGSQAQGDDINRRSIYLLRKNIDVPPALKAFGAKPREKSVIHRPESITPIQALASLNQPLVVEAATVLASDVQTLTDNDEARLRLLYQRVLQREPLPDELRVFNATRSGRENETHEFWINQARTLLSLREATVRS